jgi:hypothetical protein
MKTIRECLHCCNVRAIEGRGLCVSCWNREVVRYQYPTLRDFYGNQELDSPAPIPPVSTDARPGTSEKIRVMCERVNSGYQPHHPDDAKTPLSVSIVSLVEVSSCQ